jgi:hypothetical protein
MLPLEKRKAPGNPRPIADQEPPVRIVMTMSMFSLRFKDQAARAS